MNDDVTTGIQAQYELASQTDVYAVSPAFLYGIENTAGCVVDSATGDARPVTIVSSELGRTLVIFTDSQPAPQSVSLGHRFGDGPWLLGSWPRQRSAKRRPSLLRPRTTAMWVRP